MNKNKFILTILTIVILIVIIYVITINMNSSENDTTDTNYSINIPEEWMSADPNENYDAIYSPNVGSNIYLYIRIPQNLDIGQSISTIANNIIEIEQSKYPTFSLISSKNIDVKTVSAYEIIYTYSENNVDFKIKHAPIKDKDILYELIYKAPEDLFDQYVSEINNAIFSFRTS